jgi:hypothetical protein
MQKVKLLKAKSVVPSQRDMYNSFGENKKETTEGEVHENSLGGDMMKIHWGK